MYCEDSAATDIDHFCPRQAAPLLTFVWLNYLLACSTCNSNYKRNEFPLDDAGAPLLIDPSAEDPTQHLELSPATGRYVPRNESSKGLESIRVFGLNRSLLEIARRETWVLMHAIVVAYARAADAGDAAQQDRYARLVTTLPHPQVIVEFLSDDGETGLVQPECIEIMERLPEIRDWVQ
jgi:uncharacterized protein (TIGR02646 family)